MLWGRRRVGKTELLNHFAEGKRAFVFEATDATEAIQLRNLAEELSMASGNDLYRQAPFPDWRAALEALAQYVGEQRTVIVLDEFQFLAARQPELASLLSSWLRRVGRRVPLLFVVAGSAISFFRGEVLAGQLYGRRTGQLELKPFKAKDAALFTPGYGPADRIRTFAICGGTPYYLRTFDDQVPLADNILRNILQRDGLLHEEAELLLRQELPEPLNHFSVLEAIARGATRTSRIASQTGLEVPQVSQTLRALERLDLVEQRRPVTAGPRSTKTSWAILDGFLNFSFRFVEPYRSRLRTRQGAERHLRATVLPQLDQFVAKPAWEAICQDHLLMAEDAKKTGAWWGKVKVAPRQTEEREIDAMAIDFDGKASAVASCKWTSRPVGVSEYRDLVETSALIPEAEGVARYYLYSQAGFTADMKHLAESDPERLHLVEPADLYTAA